jgi:hypothetical protein
VANEYTLVVAGETTQQEMAERLGVRFETKGRGAWHTWHLDMIISLHRSTDGYFECDGWLWKPKRYLHVGFRASWEYDPRALTTNLLALVDRALETGSEDMAFVHLGDHLLLERRGHVVRQTDAGFWNNAEP